MTPLPTDLQSNGLSVRISVTERCQLRCTYCMPEKGCSRLRDTGRELSHDKILLLLRSLHQHRGVRRLRITGGEPLLRSDIVDLVGALRQTGIREIALTTNAQLLPGLAARLAEAGVDRLNVSLDSVVPSVFERVTRGGVLSRTLRGIEAAQAAGIGPVKLNMVVLRGVNEAEVGGMLRHALRSGCMLRYLELMPIGAGGTHFQEEFVSSEEVRRRLEAEGWTLKPLPWNFRETSRDWEVLGPGGERGLCGFISPTSQPFCEGCLRLRITSDGYLYGCLARDIRHDLSPVYSASGYDAAQAAWAGLLPAAFAVKQGAKYVTAVPSMSMIGG